MNHLLWSTGALFLLSCLVPMGCPPPPPPAQPVVVTDAGFYYDDAQAFDQSPCGRACSRRVELGCPVGPGCLKVCLEVVNQRLIANFDPECIANASDKSQISKCAGVSCP